MGVGERPHLLTDLQGLAMVYLLGSIVSVSQRFVDCAPFPFGFGGESAVAERLLFSWRGTSGFMEASGLKLLQLRYYHERNKLD